MSSFTQRWLAGEFDEASSDDEETTMVQLAMAWQYRKMQRRNEQGERKGGYFMDKSEQTQKEASEDATRESLIAISYRLPEKKDHDPELTPGDLNKSENLVDGITRGDGDGEEKYRSKLISIANSESPDTKSVPVRPGVPVGPGNIKG